MGLNPATLKSRENACLMMPTDPLPYPPPSPTPGIWVRVMGSGDIPERAPPWPGTSRKKLVLRWGRRHRWAGFCVDHPRGSPGVGSEVSTRSRHGGEKPHMLAPRSPGPLEKFVPICTLPGSQWTVQKEGRRWGERSRPAGPGGGKCGHWWGQRCPQGEGAEQGSWRG